MPTPAARHAAPRLALPVVLAALLALTALGCEKEQRVVPGTATEPVQAVALLSQHLRDNDLQAFARDAVPPPLRPQLAAAWRAGRTRWPLDELPFDHKIPGILATLSADKADVALRRSFDRQFANAHSEIRAAASALGMFGVKFLQSDDALSAEERAHYAQLVSAMSEWGAKAKLGDPKRGRSAIARLTLAARQTGLRGEADFAQLGIDDSLRRLTPVIAALKDTLRSYDLDLDESLDAMTLSLDHQDGNRARVRMRYRLAGQAIDTLVAVERIDGRWYLSDFLRHARAAAAPPPTPAAAPVVPLTETATKQPPSS
jgi:hypothetical protein